AKQHPDDEGGHDRDGRDGEEPQGADDRETILAGRGIVVEAEQEDLLDWRADRAVGRLDQAEAQIAGLELDPIEVARELAAGRQQHEAARVRERLLIRIVVVAEAHAARELLDRRLIAREEVTGGLGAWTAIAREPLGLLLQRQRRGLRRVDADRDELEVAPGL